MKNHLMEFCGGFAEKLDITFFTGQAGFLLAVASVDPLLMTLQAFVYRDVTQIAVVEPRC